MTMITRPGAAPGPLALGAVLEALAAPDSYDYIVLPGLPVDAIYIHDREAVLAVTSLPAPFLREAMADAAEERQLDIVLLRIGAMSDRTLQIFADVALGALPSIPYIEHDLEIWRGDESALWLVPPAFGPTIAVTREGFNLHLIPPYATLAGRSAGIARAAYRLAALADPEHVR